MRRIDPTANPAFQARSDQLRRPTTARLEVGRASLAKRLATAGGRLAEREQGTHRDAKSLARARSLLDARRPKA